MGLSDDKKRIKKISDIRAPLLAWGKEHYRDFPWRRTRDPFCILVAEVLLHRTRADQVQPIYERFIREYPDLFSLQCADPEKISELLRPLGLRWRTNLLMKMVLEIGRQYGGEIPLNREHLMELPGVGDYITSALLIFSGTSSEPILDTNTVRVIGRVFGLLVNDSSRRNNQFRQIMQQLTDSPDAINISFSVIDLAALVCLPQKPLCTHCPLRLFCLWATINAE